MENLLLDENGHIQLIDFGLAKWLKYGGRTGSICGTLHLMPPEICAGKWYNHSADWWSLGIIAYALITGSYPLPLQLDHFTMASAIASCDYCLPEGTHPDLVSLVSGLLNSDPAERIHSLYALQKEPIFRDLELSKLEEKELSPRLILEKFIEDKTKSNFETFAGSTSTPKHRIIPTQCSSSTTQWSANKRSVSSPLLLHKKAGMRHDNGASVPILQSPLLKLARQNCHPHHRPIKMRKMRYRSSIKPPSLPSFRDAGVSEIRRVSNSTQEIHACVHDTESSSSNEKLLSSSYSSDTSASSNISKIRPKSADFSSHEITVQMLSPVSSPIPHRNAFKRTLPTIASSPLPPSSPNPSTSPKSNTSQSNQVYINGNMLVIPNNTLNIPSINNPTFHDNSLPSHENHYFDFKTLISEIESDNMIICEGINGSNDGIKNPITDETHTPLGELKSVNDFLNSTLEMSDLSNDITSIDYINDKVTNMCKAENHISSSSNNSHNFNHDLICSDNLPDSLEEPVTSLSSIGVSEEHYELQQPMKRNCYAQLYSHPFTSSEEANGSELSNPLPSPHIIEKPCRTHINHVDLASEALKKRKDRISECQKSLCSHNTPPPTPINSLNSNYVPNSFSQLNMQNSHKSENIYRKGLKVKTSPLFPHQYNGSPISPKINNIRTSPHFNYNKTTSKVTVSPNAQVNLSNNKKKLSELRSDDITESSFGKSTESYYPPVSNSDKTLNSNTDKAFNSNTDKAFNSNTDKTFNSNIIPEKSCTVASGNKPLRHSIDNSSSSPEGTRNCRLTHTSSIIDYRSDVVNVSVTSFKESKLAVSKSFGGLEFKESLLDNPTENCRLVRSSTNVASYDVCNNFHPVQISRNSNVSNNNSG